MRHSIFLMNLEFLYQCIVSMPLISEVLWTYTFSALFATLREFFPAYVYCVVYLSPGRQCRKDIYTLARPLHPLRIQCMFYAWQCRDARTTRKQKFWHDIKYKNPIVNLLLSHIFCNFASIINKYYKPTNTTSIWNTFLQLCSAWWPLLPTPLP